MQIRNSLVQIIKLLSASSTNKGTYTQLIRLPCLIDILNCLLQINQLLRNLLLGLLSILHCLCLKGLNPLQNRRNIVRSWLELLARPLDFINDLLVLQYGTIISEIDGCAGSLEMIEFGVGVDIAFAEGS